MGEPGLEREMQRTVARVTDRLRRPAWMGATAGDLLAALRADERRWRRLVRASKFALPALALAAGLGLYLWLRPRPTPDYDSAPIDELFDFTLLRDEFNRLPIEERLRLLSMLRERIGAMGAAESALLAAFAAGIMGEARKQLEENVSLLMIDLWDRYAIDYADVPAEDRDAYLDRTYVDFVRTMATLAGDEPDETDEELLAEAREDVREGYAWVRSDDGPGGMMMGRAFDVMNNNVGSNASPQQRARGQVLMRDMTRRLRGQPIDGGR